MVINMWLLPEGKQVLVETYEGEIKKINIKDIYNQEAKKTKLKLGSRMTFYHGSNNFLFMGGNTQYFDQEVLQAVFENRFIDTRNVAYDIDIDKSFTWDVDELMRSDIKRVSIYLHLYNITSFMYRNITKLITTT